MEAIGGESMAAKKDGSKLNAYILMQNYFSLMEGQIFLSPLP